MFSKLLERLCSPKRRLNAEYAVSTAHLLPYPVRRLQASCTISLIRDTASLLAGGPVSSLAFLLGLTTDSIPIASRRPYESGEVRRFAANVLNGVDHWFTFLTVPGVEPTNNRAERALREHVVQRKIMGCFRNGKGTMI
jgi:hypothetical protein